MKEKNLINDISVILSWIVLTMALSSIIFCLYNGLSLRWQDIAIAIGSAINIFIHRRKNI